MPAGLEPETLRPAVLDRMGITLSGICIVHCLWMPVLLAALPLWPGVSHLHAWAHPALALSLVPVTWMAARSASRQSRLVPALLGLGLILVTAAFALHGVGGDGVEAALTLAGSTVLVGGHGLNWRIRRLACAACPSPHPESPCTA